MKTIFIRLAFLLLGVSCVGCVYVPEKTPVYRSCDVGTTAAAPLQVGVADRKAVIARWGEPSYRSEHDLAFGYLHATKVGTRSGLMMGPCMPFIGVIDVDDMDDIWLAFDEHGVLRRYQKHLIRTSWWNGYENDDEVWTRFAQSVHDKPLGLLKNDD